MAEKNVMIYAQEGFSGYPGVKGCKAQSGDAIFAYAAPKIKPWRPMEKDLEYQIKVIRTEEETIQDLYQTDTGSNIPHIQYVNMQEMIWTECDTDKTHVYIANPGSTHSHSTHQGIIQITGYQDRFIFVVQSFEGSITTSVYDYGHFKCKGFQSQPLEVIENASNLSVCEIDEENFGFAYQSFDDVYTIKIEKRNKQFKKTNEWTIKKMHLFCVTPHLSYDGNNLFVCYRQDFPWGFQQYDFTKDSVVVLHKIGEKGNAFDQVVPMIKEIEQHSAFSPMAIHEKEGVRLVYRNYRGQLTGHNDPNIINDWGWQLHQCFRYHDGRWTRPHVFSMGISYHDDYPVFVPSENGLVFMNGCVDFDHVREKTCNYRYRLGINKVYQKTQVMDHPTGDKPIHQFHPEPKKQRFVEEDMNCYFGDLHRHSYLSKCIPEYDGSIEQHLQYAKMVRDFDFYALTDHAYQVNSHEWNWLMDMCDQYDLTVLYGLEITYDGHSNFYAKTKKAAQFLHQTFSHIDPLEKAFKTAQKANLDQDLMCIRHFHGDLLTHQHMTDENNPNGYQKGYDHVIEAVQTRGHSPKTIQALLNKGIKIGFMGSSDHSRPKGAPQGGIGIYEQAITGVWAPKMDKESLFGSFKQRRCFSTNGPKMAGWIKVNDVWMGGVDKSHKKRTICAKGYASTQWKKIVLIKNGKIMEVFETDEITITDEDTSPAYYQMIGIQSPQKGQHYPGILYSSPVWCEGE